MEKIAITKRAHNYCPLVLLTAIVMQRTEKGNLKKSLKLKTNSIYITIRLYTQATVIAPLEVRMQHVVRSTTATHDSNIVSICFKS